MTKRLRRFATWPRPPRLECYGFLVTLLIELLQIGTQRIQVIVEALQQFFARRTSFFNDRIFPHGYSSASSSGVQMTGGASKPAARHVSMTNRSIRAFAMCLQ